MKIAWLSDFVCAGLVMDTLYTSYTHEAAGIPAAVPDNWQLTFSDEFEGSGSLDVDSAERNWRFESMDDALHRAGNTGMDELGS